MDRTRSSTAIRVNLPNPKITPVEGRFQSTTLTLPGYNITLHRLNLVRPSRDTNIRLNPRDAFLMNQRVGETDHLNNLIPRPLNCCSRWIHLVLQTCLLTGLRQQPLNIRNLLRERSGMGSNRNQGEVGSASCRSRESWVVKRHGSEIWLFGL